MSGLKRLSYIENCLVSIQFSLLGFSIPIGHLARLENSTESLKEIPFPLFHHQFIMQIIFNLVTLAFLVTPALSGLSSLGENLIQNPRLDASKDDITRCGEYDCTVTEIPNWTATHVVGGLKADMVKLRSRNGKSNSNKGVILTPDYDLIKLSQTVDLEAGHYRVYVHAYSGFLGFGKELKIQATGFGNGTVARRGSDFESNPGNTVYKRKNVIYLDDGLHMVFKANGTTTISVSGVSEPSLLAEEVYVISIRLKQILNK